MTLSPKFAEALTLAHELHAGQDRRFGDVPYLTHLLAVCALVGENGGDETAMTAALLHDAVEDCGGLAVEARIRERFGDRVADVVMGCTDSTEPDPDRKRPWRERKEKYLAHLDEADRTTRLVSLCDKVHNLRTLLAELDAADDPDGVFAAFRAGRDGVLWYYRQLADRFARDDVRLADEFAAMVRRLETYGA